MFESIRQRLRRTKWEAIDLAWTEQWRAIRLAATPWMKQEFAAARAKLSSEARPTDVMIDRDALDGWIRDAAPPGVPYEVVVLPGSELRARFGPGDEQRRSLHMLGKMRMTHRALPSEAVVVIALFSDVAADYYVETMAADVAADLNRAYKSGERPTRSGANGGAKVAGKAIAVADAQSAVPVVLKEIATAAGLGRIGKNALFFSHRFGFNCKLAVVLLDAPVTRYEPTPTTAEWKLPDCSTCNLCVEACPVGAFDDYVITKVPSCDRVIAGDFFGARRDHMCRACITRCPVSNDVLKLRRKEGAPQRKFWDNEAQLSIVADLFADRPSFWIWVLQRFYYGAGLPGRERAAKKDVASVFTSALTITTSDRTRDGWRLGAKKRG